MVQENEPRMIPDELYNLTQLAEVTLAAGKLSTTNLQQIKEYFRQENDYDLRPPSHSNLHRHNSTESYSSQTDSNAEDSFDENNLPRQFIDWNWRGTDTNFHHNHHQRQTDLYQYSHDHYHHHYQEEHISHSSMKQINDDHTITVTPPSPNDDHHNPSISTDSNDSSSYNYSHKIFDKRKSRKFAGNKMAQIDNIPEEKLMKFSSPSMSSPSLSEDADIETNSQSSDDGNSIRSRDDGDSGSGGCDNEENVGNLMNLIKEEKLDNLITDDIHICPECGKKYSTSSNLARHRQTHRSLEDKKARRCPHCDKVYVSMPAYSMHVRTHNQGCECPHCGKCFSRPWLLQGHIRTHTGEKPFKCSICSKAFADKSNLRAHIQTHSNTKPHSCGRCGKSFALKSYLYKHEESSCMRNHVKSDTKILKMKKSHHHHHHHHHHNNNNDPEKTINSNIIVFKLDRKSGLKNGISKHERKSREVSSRKTNEIFLEESTNKSYLNLSESMPSSSTSASRNDEKFSRISVIRTAAIPPIPKSSSCETSSEQNNNNNNNDKKKNLYQDEPMDFSAKKTRNWSTCRQ